MECHKFACSVPLASMGVRTRDIWEHQHIRLKEASIFVAVLSVSIIPLISGRFTPGESTSEYWNFVCKLTWHVLEVTCMK
jgi:hypothetical protein